MATLKTHCSDETKARFRMLAASSGLSEAMLMRRMVAAVVARHSKDATAVPKSDIRGGRGGYGSRLMLRLRQSEVQAIRALAEPEGYSAQAWIVRQLRHRLEDAVPFAKDELDELRDAIRELAALGRNLNSLLHVLHRSDRFEEGRLDLQALHSGVDKLRKTVTATMTRATHRGYRGEA